VHLVQKWLATLDKKMEASFEHPNDNYRIFITAEPASDPLYHIIPQVFVYRADVRFLYYNRVWSKSRAFWILRSKSLTNLRRE